MLKYKLTAGYYVQLFQYDNKVLIKKLNKGNTLLYELDTIKKYNSECKFSFFETY